MWQTNFTVDFKKSIVCFAKFKLENMTVDYAKCMWQIIFYLLDKISPVYW